MAVSSPEDESKRVTQRQVDLLTSSRDEFGWRVKSEDAGDYLIIFLLFVSRKNGNRALLARLKCDDYPRQAPLLEFLDPSKFDEASGASQPRAEFYPTGSGIANDPSKSPFPIVCLEGHRHYYAAGWHQGWSVPPPSHAEIYPLATRLQLSLDNDWS
jgi:hypothetical protein